MVTERNTEIRQPASSVFNAGAEALRKENQRIQRDLKLALEERNRLLRKLNSATASAGHTGNSRILDQRLEELRLETGRLRRTQQELEAERDRQESRAEELAQFQLLILERLEGMAGAEGEQTSGNSDGTPAFNEIADRFNRAFESLWQRLNKRNDLFDGMLDHEVQRLRQALAEQRETQAKGDAERRKYREIVKGMRHVQRELERSLDEREKEGIELRERVAVMRQEKTRMQEGIDRREAEIRRLNAVRHPENVMGWHGRHPPQGILQNRRRLVLVAGAALLGTLGGGLLAVTSRRFLRNRQAQVAGTTQRETSTRD